MPAPIVLTLASVACFLSLVHMAVTVPPAAFRVMTNVMILAAVLLALVAPTAGVALLAPLAFARYLGRPVVPATVPARYVRRYGSQGY